MNTPFNITSPSCKLWLPPGPGQAYQNYSLPDQWLGSAGAQIPENAPVQRCYDNSGNSNHINQSSSSAAPLLSQFGSITESQEPALRFRSASSQFLPIPSSVNIGDGSPASEATIIACLRAQPGNAGFLWATGSQGFWPISPTTVGIYSGGNNPFPNPFAINTFGPQVLAVRFKSGETKLFGDTNYTDTLPTNFLSGTTSGGFISSFNGTGYFGDFDLYDFALFDQALSDADVLKVMQGMKDRVAPNEGLYAQVLAFGDSRTFGYNSTAGPFNPARSWPGRAKRALGGIGQWYSSAHVGDTIANQSTALTSYLTLLKPAVYSRRIVIGEIGINDIRAGSSAATIQTAMTSLAAQILAGGATQLLWLTIAPAASLTTPQETVRQTVNAWLLAGGLPAVTIIDNASDPRLTIPGYPDTDGLHFYDPGYGVYAENVTAVLKPLLFNSANSVNLNYGTFKAA